MRGQPLAVQKGPVPPIAAFEIVRACLVRGHGARGTQRLASC